MKTLRDNPSQCKANQRYNGGNTWKIKSKQWWVLSRMTAVMFLRHSSSNFNSSQIDQMLRGALGWQKSISDEFQSLGLPIRLVSSTHTHYTEIIFEGVNPAIVLFPHNLFILLAEFRKPEISWNYSEFCSDYVFAISSNCTRKFVLIESAFPEIPVCSLKGPCANVLQADCDG